MTREPIERSRMVPQITIPSAPVIFNEHQVRIPIPPSPAMFSDHHHVRIPTVAPGTLQSPLEFWIQTETTPLLASKPPQLPPAEPQVSTPIPSGSSGTCSSPIVSEGYTSTDPEAEIESSLKIACQVFIPFIIAGLGTVGAGLLLDDVQNWEVFEMVPEMFVLVPALLGLKGNLEMTLASRVSTQANLGMIDDLKEQWRMMLGNLSLLQCQSLVLGLVASLLASIVGWIREGEFNIHNVLLLTSSSLLTAAVASFVLGSLTVFVVVCSRRFNVNPDNVAAPLSASLGDVVTLALLASMSSLQFKVAEHDDDYIWIEAFIILVLILLVPMWATFAYRCPYTRQVLYSGWIPVISAVAISSGGGYILNFAVARFKGIAACQPVINGVGGNLVAVQACRISTYLHQRSKPGLMSTSLENGHSEGNFCVSPCAAWFGNNAHARTAKILFLMSIPGHLIFISMVHFLKSQYSPLTIEFLGLYLCAALLQVALLLYLAHCLVHLLWKFGLDPDDAAIPYLTAMGDLLGTGFLFVAFIIMDSLQ